jgi:ribosome-interacting GTPase 1
VATNLPPQYFEVEKKLKTAKTNQEKIEIYEELLAIVPKHKASEKLQAQIKTKLSQLKTASEKKSGAARHGSSYIIDKSGAGQVIVVGPPNSGKSLFIKALTGANPEVGDYPFTTKNPAPFMMKFENIRIQLIDTPPVTVDFMETGLAEAAKIADDIMVVIDVASPEAASDLENVILKLKEKKVELIAPDKEVPETVPPYYKRSLVIANKSDLDAGGANLADLRMLFKDQLEILPFAANDAKAAEALKQKVYLMLDIIRVYSKAPGKKADKEEPFTLKRGSTVQDMARAVHKDFHQNLKYARLWRASNSAYQGSMVNRDQVLEDEDTVELHL